MSCERCIGWPLLAISKADKNKNPAEAGFCKKLKLTDKAASFNHTSGICGAGVVLCYRLYPILYRNKSPETLLAVSRIEGPAIGAVL